jgi:imidazolonepropionase-like amidohydrolase
MTTRYVWAPALTLFSVFANVAAQDSVPQVTAIKAGRLLDGTTRPAIENAVVVIRGDRIEAVGPAANVRIPADARVIDLTSDTVMPGLINGHDHPTVRAFTGPEVARQGRNALVQQLNQMGEPPAQQAARGVRDLRVDLLSGVTTEYVVGEVNFNDVHLKKMAQDGVIPAPRMYLSGPWIMPSSGYDPIPPTNGPWAMREMVRRNVEAGAHHIKVVITHGEATGASAGRPFAGTNFTKEEIDAVVEEAHRLGVKVTAHAGDVDSERLALEAGADSIQHASNLTPEIMELFIKTKASIVSTYAATMQTHFTPEDFRFLDTQANCPEDWVGRARAILGKVAAGAAQAPASNGKTPRQRTQDRYAQLRTARDRGIPIAVGTDNMQGLLQIDIEYLVDAGFTPLEAIGAATGAGAKALGIEREVGTLENGKFADIISVKGNPDQNIRDLTHINFIMVGGRTFSGLSFR